MMFCPWHIWFDFVQASLGMIERVTFVRWPFPRVIIQTFNTPFGPLGPQLFAIKIVTASHIVHSYVYIYMW